jgi:hypothetical protein
MVNFQEFRKNGEFPRISKNGEFPRTPRNRYPKKNKKTKQNRIYIYGYVNEIPE